LCFQTQKSKTWHRLLSAVQKQKTIRNEKEKAEGSNPYSGWNVIAKGYHGEVAVNPEGSRVVKTLLAERPDGTSGKFGEFEVELATKMGELGHSPRVRSSSPRHIEMDFASGKPLWASYQKGEKEPVMNASQAKAAGYAIRDLHRLGYAHKDAHSQQFLVDGDRVMLVDYGLSRPVSEKRVAVLQDLAKMNPLVRFDNPDLSDDPYFQLVNKYLTPYRELGKSRSQAAMARREELAKGYLDELNSLT
jgi:tRNA A-37 threonylcarbamoyl transferase component Bud32